MSLSDIAARGGARFATWATPRAGTNHTRAGELLPPSAGGRSSKPGLAQQAAGRVSLLGAPALNARFVEWLMGLPTGWTNCGVLGMRSFRLWQQWHSAYLQAVLASRGSE